MRLRFQTWWVNSQASMCKFTNFEIWDFYHVKEIMLEKQKKNQIFFKNTIQSQREIPATENCGLQIFCCNFWIINIHSEQHIKNKTLSKSYWLILIGFEFMVEKTFRPQNTMRTCTSWTNDLVSLPLTHADAHTHSNIVYIMGSQHGGRRRISGKAW